MSTLDLAAFDAVPLRNDPFVHVVVPGFVRPEALEDLKRDYPRIEQPGAFPLEKLEYGPAFGKLLEEFHGDEVRAHFAAKFGVDLTDRPVMATARRFCEASDGAIHTDSRTKILTILVYFNEEWHGEGGRLRLLRAKDDIEQYVSEVVPRAGTMVAFRPSRRSYHGHKPFVGERRVLQLHWVDAKRIERNEKKRRSWKWRARRALGFK